MDGDDERTAGIDALLAGLNDQQRLAVQHGHDPLLIVAGAGTGKTATLVHRVVWLIAQGADPARILLLTFTRRAAAEMIRRVDAALRQLGPSGLGGSSPFHAGRIWGGTFHAVATRLLRRYGKAVGLAPDFTIHDRTDSEDLLNVIRGELGLAKTQERFPNKAACMAIYSRCVNARQPLDQALPQHFPWCQQWADELKRLFNAYVDRKEASSVLDYDDLLVYWHSLVAESSAADRIRGRFDCILVDEYQDTNVLQAEILYQLSPEGRGLTVVGDDAQSIYSFRAATVHNILDFPKHYPGAAIVPLEQNYRSTQPILDAANAVIGLARQRYAKKLWTPRADGDKPLLVICEDENDQADYLIRQILDRREASTLLRHQAVLFRASHHSILLETELARRSIPFHKYGGLKFVEAAHVKDLMAFLRLAENPRDVIAGTRILALLPGIGPRKAHQLIELLARSETGFEVWQSWKPPAASQRLWPEFVDLLAGLHRARTDLPGQIERVRTFYQPILDVQYDNPRPRARDLEQLAQIAARYRDRRTMLAEIALDPPASTQDLAGQPQLDDDYLVLSTIHSAKGLEWDAVYVIHASDGNIPSDMATGSSEEIEEELRLFYVALSRAKRWLTVCYPLRYYHYPSSFHGAYGFAQPTRFLPESALRHFQRATSATPDHEEDDSAEADRDPTSPSIRNRTKRYWS